MQGEKNTFFGRQDEVAQVALPEISSSQNKTSNPIKERRSANRSAVSVATAASGRAAIGRLPPCRKACNWPIVIRCFIASMATLLPYCSGKVREGEKGETTQTLPLHNSSFVPECL